MVKTKWELTYWEEFQSVFYSKWPWVTCFSAVGQWMVDCMRNCFHFVVPLGHFKDLESRLRQTSDTRCQLLEIGNAQPNCQTNSILWNGRETTYPPLSNKPRVKGKLCHVQQIDVWRKRDSESIIRSLCLSYICAASNFIALIPYRSIRQMLANFGGVEFQRTVGEVKKKEDVVLCLRPLQNVKLFNFTS